MGNSIDLIRDRVIKRRMELGLSLQDMSDRTGISKSTLQRYETGSIGSISLDKLEVLANALQIEPWELMGWDEPPLRTYPGTADPLPAAPKYDLTKADIRMVARGGTHEADDVEEFLRVAKYMFPKAYAKIMGETPEDADKPDGKG